MSICYNLACMQGVDVDGSDLRCAALGLMHEMGNTASGWQVLKRWERGGDHGHMCTCAGRTRHPLVNAHLFKQAQELCSCGQRSFSYETGARKGWSTASLVARDGFSYVRLACGRQRRTDAGIVMQQ